LIKSKNLDILIEVFSKIIKKTDKPLILKIIGEGPEFNNLKLKIANLKLEGKVVLKKSIPHESLLKEIQKCYLCVLPALTDISPNLALECIKLRKPILLTKETGIYEDFKDHLIFIDPKNEKEIEEKILYLLDEKNYQNYIERIKNIPTSYSWKDVIERHLSIFKNS
jgi:glycosyltransferase involved in cell wall biosynthesis